MIEEARARPRRWWVWALVVLAVVGALGMGWWARGATLVESTPASEEIAGELVLAEVVPASVGRSMTLGVTVRQPLQTVAVNHLAGVVTAAGGGEVSAGDVLYAVAGTPVVAVEGDVPFYRDLSAGARGEDVTQLQEALGALGHLRAEPDGVFGSATTAAVRAWQRDLGLEATGTVPLGHVVALRSLPMAVSLGEQVFPGAQLAGGEEAVRAPSGEQRFVLVLSPSQEALVPAGATVTIPYEGNEWQAVAAASAVDSDSGQLEMELTAPDSGPVCGSECGVLPADETLSILSTVVAVPPEEGLGVPAAAVRTRPDTSTYVVLDDGTEREVEVRGTGQGLAIIDGLDEGERVQVGEAAGLDQEEETAAGTTPGETATGGS